ncbi:patatin-like phospholipase family protein [Peribacillus glennii]|uniref:Patatin family protein n=1 Tax=Peribacillus glennii TaxID=2303991 RepID=A0A372LEU0_9BACI|nr:patatin family protein [Peribacillus glennii]RFU64808.1 patatin family protein [Peribacillus glennii]
MERTGLVLEGGGMRGVFTAGVIRYLMEQEIFIPYVIGVSAGACNGSSYISRQIERNRITNIDFIRHPEYISIKRFLKKRELFGMDFIFDKLPNELAPFDFETFNHAKEEFVVGATDCITGDPVYFEKSSFKKDILTILRASSSLPMMAPIINFHGKHLMDGGISDPIPIRKSQQDGNVKNVVVLTRNKGYQKEEQSMKWLFKRKYSQYEGLLHALSKRHEVYNDTLGYLEDQESKGNVLIIRPTEKMEVGRVERSPQKLAKLYQQGYEEAKRNHKNLNEFLRGQSPIASPL